MSKLDGPWLGCPVEAGAALMLAAVSAMSCGLMFGLDGERW
ncbi:hypothetical protein WME91_48305 [Sorangium sp. So ce269]